MTLMPYARTGLKFHHHIPGSCLATGDAAYHGQEGRPGRWSLVIHVGWQMGGCPTPLLLPFHEIWA